MKKVYQQPTTKQHQMVMHAYLADISGQGAESQGRGDIGDPFDAKDIYDEGDIW